MANDTGDSTQNYEAASYGIDTAEDAAHIFSVLRNQIYSRKLLAVIREYMTNAQDEHFACGYGDLPIEVKLPTVTEPTFTVRDFGRGLTQEQVFNVYAKYGKSTKRGQAGYNGQLGLGAKAAFSYTDSWLINSFMNGVKTVYNASIDDSGVGKIYKLLEVPTTEPSGVMIEVSINRGDIYSMNREFQSFVKHFSPRPRMAANSAPADIPERPKPIALCKNVELYSNGGEGGVVVMANVAYPVDTYTLSNSSHFNSKVDTASRTWFFENAPYVLIRANPGDMVISASRESLDYREKTVSYIASAVNGIVADLKSQLRAQVDACPNAAAAIRKIWDLRQGSHLAPLQNSYFEVSAGKMSHRGASYPTVWRLPKDTAVKAYTFSVFSRYKMGQGYVYGLRGDSTDIKETFDFVDSGHMLVVFDIPAKDAIARIKAAASADNRDFWCDKYIGVELPEGKTADDILPGIEPSLVTLASSLPEAVDTDIELVDTHRVRAPARPLDVEKRRSKLFVPRRSEEDRSAKSKNWDPGKLEDGQVGYYMVIDSFAPSDLKGHSWEIARNFDNLIEAKLIKSGSKLFGVRSKDVELAKSEGLMSLKEKLVEIAEFKDEETAIAIAAAEDTIMKFAKSVGVRLMSNHAKRHTDELPDLSAVNGMLGRTYNRWARPAWEEWCKLVVSTERAEFIRQFPMLGLLSYSCFSSSDKTRIGVISEYVKGVAAARGIPLEPESPDQAPDEEIEDTEDDIPLADYDDT